MLSSLDQPTAGANASISDREHAMRIPDPILDEATCQQSCGHFFINSFLRAVSSQETVDFTLRPYKVSSGFALFRAQPARIRKKVS